jgi:hypothetical protein
MKLHSLFLTFLGLITCYASLLQGSPPLVQDVSDYSLVEESPPTETLPPLNDPPDSPCLIDFDKIAQDFVLETKKIKIPGHPFAFNPSMVRWKGALLMSFRTYNPETRSTNPFGLVWLDENFEPIGTPQLFELPFKNPVLMSKQQDPRLITVGDRLYVVYNNILEHVTHREMRRMFIVEMRHDGGAFAASEPECLLNYEGENGMRYEKNWVPFEYNNELLLSYSIIPHQVFRPVLGTNSCETLFSTHKPFRWNWGVPRGGTQAIIDGDHYIAFFHSWENIPSANPVENRSPIMSWELIPLMPNRHSRSSPQARNLSSEKISINRPITGRGNRSVASFRRVLSSTMNPSGSPTEGKIMKCGSLKSTRKDCWIV